MIQIVIFLGIVKHFTIYALREEANSLKKRFLKEKEKEEEKYTKTNKNVAPLYGLEPHLFNFRVPQVWSHPCK